MDAMNLKVDGHSPIPIRRQLMEQLRHVIEGGGVPKDQALPSIRELAGFLGVNPNTVARVIDDLKQSGYVEARRGKGVFVAQAPPARPSPHLRETFLQDAVIRAAALGMTVDDLSVGVLSLAGIRPAAIRGAVGILLVECSPPELDFFARQLEAHLPVRVDKMLLAELAAVTRRPKQARRWRAAVTSFSHLPQVERLLKSKGVPVIALLAEAHLETLHRLAQFPSGTRVGVASTTVETAHNLEHSIANANLPNIALVGVCPAEGAALGRLVRGGFHRAGDDRRSGPRPAGDRNARDPSGATKRRSADGRPGADAAEVSPVRWTQIARGHDARDGAGEVMRVSRNQMKEEES